MKAVQSIAKGAERCCQRADASSRTRLPSRYPHSRTAASRRPSSIVGSRRGLLGVGLPGHGATCCGAVGRQGRPARSRVNGMWAVAPGRIRLWGPRCRRMPAAPRWRSAASVGPAPPGDAAQSPAEEDGSPRPDATAFGAGGGSRGAEEARRLEEMWCHRRRTSARTFPEDGVWLPRLSAEAAAVAAESLPGAERRVQQERLLERLEAALRGTLDGCTVALFGSAANGLWTASSDLDVCVLAPGVRERHSQQRALRKVSQLYCL